MTTLSPRQLLERQSWRYATKTFDAAKKLSPETVQALEESLVLTPSSFGLQPWRFVVVSNPALKTELKAVSWNQPQISDCSHLVVFQAATGLTEADIDAFIADTAAKRGQTVEQLAGYRGMMVGFLTGKGPLAGRQQEWAARQCYIALGNLMTSAAVLGVDACPLEGIDPAAYDKLVGTPGYATVVACALGYRGQDKYAAAAKVRWPASQVIVHR